MKLLSRLRVKIYVPYNVGGETNPLVIFGRAEVRRTTPIWVSRSVEGILILLIYVLCPSSLVVSTFFYSGINFKTPLPSTFVLDNM